MPEGASTVVETMAPTNWRAKVAQWYDASERDTLGGYPKNADGSAVGGNVAVKMPLVTQDIL